MACLACIDCTVPFVLRPTASTYTNVMEFDDKLMAKMLQGQAAKYDSASNPPELGHGLRDKDHTARKQ